MLGLFIKITTDSVKAAQATAAPPFASLFAHGLAKRWVFSFLLLVIIGLSVTALPVYADEPTFFTRSFFGTGNDPTYGVVMGDVNGDGYLDLVTINDSQHTVVYLNDGKGRFPVEKSRSFGAAGEIPRSVAVGDINGDGYLDLITGNLQSKNVIYINDGQGNFSNDTRRLFATGKTDTVSIAVGDVDGDGHLDIVTAEQSGNYTVYINDGKGNFPEQLKRALDPVISTTSAVALGDVNNDGHLDIITVGFMPRNRTYFNNRIYFNNGKGIFSINRSNPFGTASDATSSVAVGDVNGDGHLDLITGNEGGQNVVYLNDGQGNFSKGKGHPFGTGSDATHSVAVGDLNEDGYLDIVTGNYLQQNVVYLNDGQGNFPQANGLALGRGHDATSSIAIGDVDRDGHLDLVTANVGSRNVVYLNDGQGNFSQGNVHIFGTGIDTTRSVALGDMDGDGYLDLVTGNYNFTGDPSDQNVVYFNDGNGNFQQRESHRFGTVHDQPQSVAVGDVNHDGHLDIITNVGPQDMVYINDGHGNFPPGNARPFGTGSDHPSVAVGDMNGDGALDIISGNEHSQDMVYINDGQGDFSKGGTRLGVNYFTHSVAVGDLNNDGQLDVVIASRQIQFYLNDGRGNFTTDEQRTLNTYYDGVALGDINDDGSLDLIMWLNGGQNRIFLNDGQGNFSIGNSRPFGTGSDATTSVAVGDVNGDGHLDLVTGNRFLEDMVYFNDGQGNFPEEDSYVFGSGNGYDMRVAVGDVDNDGRIDIIVGSDGSQNLVNLNRIGQSSSLPNQAPSLIVSRPVTTANADFLSSPTIINRRIIPIPYTLFDREGDQVGRIESFYSLNGGGQWLPAIAATNTITQNLSTGRSIVSAYLSPPIMIPASTNLPLETKLTMTASNAITLADVEVWVSITGTQNSDLAIALRSPKGIQVPLVAAGQAQGQGLQGTRFSMRADRPILSDTAPYAGTYRPLGDLKAFQQENSSGEWTLVITNTGSVTGKLNAWGLRLSSLPTRHIFYWDTFASDFFGQSDNVLIRMVAYSQPLSTTTPVTASVRYTNSMPGPFQRPYVSATTFPFRVRGTQVRVVDEKAQPLTGAIVYRLPSDQFSGATPLANSANQPFRTDTQGYLQGRGRLQVGDDLVALLPLTPTLPFTFTKQINYFLTSAAPINRGLELTKLSTPGVLTLTVPTSPTRTHPLLLFNLTVSLEWDASDDELFQLGLKEGFQRASELLYKVTNGQAAIGQVDVLPAKSYWNQADLILYASNSLHPSAAIGGVVKAPMSETVFSNGDPNAAKQSVAAAYVPGQVRMGTSWDPFGEETGDLSEQWWRALAHELSHHLFFLPDDYLGFKTAGPNAQRFLGRVDCQHSFMTTTFDPTYTKFLDRSFWLGDCLQTVAAFSTGRSDWETITHFYPMLKAPAEPPTAGANFQLAGPPDGPNLLPLDVTHLVFWSLPEPRPTLPARYFQLRDGTGQAVRLPTARVYLFQTQGTADPTDDVLLALGSPTGGGDRIKVRGGQLGDRLCLFDFGASDGKTYTGCIRQLSAGDVSIPVRALEPERTGARWAPAVDIRALTTRTLVVTVTQALSLNTPLKMQVFPAHYPSATGLAPVAALTLTHGVYVGQVSLPYPASDVAVRVWVDDGTNLEAVSQFNLQLPWKPNDPVMAGPGSPIVGGPGSPIVGGPGSPIVGGPGSPIVGGPNQPMVGGAPMRSADAQVVVYNQAGLFEPSGIESLQILPSPSELSDEPWLVPVGQAYFVEPDAKVKTLRRIAVTYLQRDVPDGYEDTLKLYYLPKGAKTWQRLPTTQFVENLVVADLQPGAGTYAVMSTVALPALHPGWNVLTYPLPDSRPVTTALASLANRYSVIYKPDPDKLIQVRQSTIDAIKHNKLKTNVSKLEFGQVYWIKLEGNQTVTPFLAPPRRAPDGSEGSMR